ncbi:hypothetical protein AALP_AA8G011100 [Arabis alpina]|uniref:Non-specific lipid-transfer protein n=1 Tax=Arabis alpina TaxID=50452 RepID=A0A087G477_ARAAL|nr:hypothetical protein AALP_AA8G011100 [Arabis alpina]
MANMRVVVPVFLLIASMVASGSEAAVNCNTVVSYLYPCATYVAQGGVVPVRCCYGIRTLIGQARTTGDRQGVCRCIKNALAGVSYTPSPKYLKNASNLLNRCRVSLPYKISPSTNCNSIR